MPSFHFSLGNSTDGAIGFCARVIATTKAEAVERLKSAIEKLTNDDRSSLFDDGSGRSPPEPGLQYLNVYFNTAAVTEAAVSDGEEEDVDYEDLDGVFHNFYKCPDDEDTWEDANCGSAHDDKCPICNKAVSPYKSDVYDSEYNLLETIDWTQMEAASANPQEPDVPPDPV